MKNKNELLKEYEKDQKGLGIYTQTFESWFLEKIREKKKKNSQLDEIDLNCDDR